jgi:predicted dehydrogenase
MAAALSGHDRQDERVTATTLPAPGTPDRKDATPLRWGILAPGGIAHSMATALRATTRQEIVAVGSRSLQRAQAFADEFSVPAAFGSYEDLVSDAAVDVVYVASPHSEHHDHALLAIAAGKHVLVEKAFTRNAAEAREVIEKARDAGVFAMEAMWTRFLPHIDVVRQVLERGLLGDVHTVMADHGQALYPQGPRRLADPELAGGALLDLGVYPVSFASFVLGGFTSVVASGVLTELGVDAQESITVHNDAGTLGILGATMLSKTPTTASICGTEARLDIEGDFYAPNVIRLVAPNGMVTDRFEPETRDYGLAFEAAEVARCVSGGLIESPLMPLDETLAIMTAMDDVRGQVGVRYPGE